MGRIEGVELHQSPDEDLYEPPPPPPPSTNYRSTPPPHQFPPPPPADELDNYNKPPPPQVHQFPPPPPAVDEQDYHKPPPPQVHQFPPPVPADEQDYIKPPPPQPFQHVHPPPLPPVVGHLSTPPPPPQQYGIPIGVQQNQLPIQPWKTDLFDCMQNPQNALITCFFPCVTFGQIAEIVDSGSTSCGTSGMVYSLIACCIAMPCIMSCTYRTKLRSKFGLVESPAPDCLIHCFCECCALCQEYRELEQRGYDPSIGWLGNVAKQQQQFGMTPPMQQRMF